MKSIIARIALPLVCVELLVGCDVGLPTGKGSIAIKSTPDQAQIFINGAPQGTTPGTVSGLAVGDCIVELQKDGYDKTFKSVSLLEGQRIELDVQMKKVTGLLLVESGPQGVDVVIDGVSKGNTPLLLTDLPLGSYKLDFRSPTHLPRTMSADLVDRKPVHVVAELISNTADLAVNSTPEGAEVRINGVLMGTTPAVIEGILTGESDVKVSLNGYKPFVKRMTFEVTQKYELNPELEAFPSMLSIITDPAGATVTVDAESVGTTPFTVNVPDGSREVEIALMGYDTVTTNLVLKPNETERLELNLVKNSGSLVLDTEPASVDVYINGRYFTTTELKGEADTISRPVSILLTAGRTHRIQLVREGYVASSFVLETELDKIVTRHEILKRIFVRDTQITTDTEVIKCRLEYELPNGTLYYEVRPGIFDSRPKSVIRNVESITLSDESNLEARRLMEMNKQVVPEQR